MLSQFVGLPWEDHGRGPEGYDCWGLFIVAFKAGTGIDLPGYDDGYASAADRAEIGRLIVGALGDWQELGDRALRPWDGILMQIAGAWHIGLAVDRRRMLHMPRGGTSVIEPVDRYRSVIRGFYRHRAGEP